MATRKDDNPADGTQPRTDLDHERAFKAAVILLGNGLPAEAADLCKKILDVVPHHARAMDLRALALNKLGHSTEALALVRQALELKPDLPQFLASMAIVLTSLDRHQEALDCYEHVFASLPDDATELKFKMLNNMGNALKDMGCHDDALEFYDKALQLGPGHAEPDWNRSHVLLTQGRFPEAWPGYERRFELAQAEQRFYPFTLPAPRWDGSSFKGKRLFIHDEQGLGDTIQFARFIPQVKKLGGEIVFEVRQPLFRLFQSLESVDHLVLRESKPSGLDYDLVAPVMSLGKLLDVTLETIPAGNPYLEADIDTVSKWKDTIVGPGFKTGIVWSCSQENIASRNRSMPLDALLPLLDIPGTSFHGFQKDDQTGQLAQLPEKYIFPNHGDNFQDFMDTAGALSNLDLLITVDTSVAHAAGAIGIPTWVLLPHPSDWRWLLERTDSPWYAGMRLFRSREPGDWNHVVELVSRELQRLLQV